MPKLLVDRGPLAAVGSATVQHSGNVPLTSVAPTAIQEDFNILVT